MLDMKWSANYQSHGRKTWDSNFWSPVRKRKPFWCPVRKGQGIDFTLAEGFSTRPVYNAKIVFMKYHTRAIIHASRFTGKSLHFLAKFHLRLLFSLPDLTNTFSHLSFLPILFFLLLILRNTHDWIATTVYDSKTPLSNNNFYTKIKNTIESTANNPYWKTVQQKFPVHRSVKFKENW